LDENINWEEEINILNKRCEDIYNLWFIIIYHNAWLNQAHIFYDNLYHMD
jgi:hypothetical protein